MIMSHSQQFAPILWKFRFFVENLAVTENRNQDILIKKEVFNSAWLHVFHAIFR